MNLIKGIERLIAEYEARARELRRAADEESHGRYCEARRVLRQLRALAWTARSA